MRRRLATATVIGACAWALALAGPAFAQVRAALVVANQSYSSELGPLTTSHADAELVANALRDAGFDVVVRRDLGRMAHLQEITALAERLDRGGPDAVGLHYYVGHGVAQMDAGENVLVPVSADVGPRFWESTLPLSQIHDQLRRRAPEADVIVVVDAARAAFGSPVELSWSGFLPKAPPDGMMQAFSATPGFFAADRDAGGFQGPYAGAFAAELADADRDIAEFLARVKASVGERTSEQQKPWHAGGFDRPVRLSAPSVTVDPVEQHIFNRASGPCDYAVFADAFPNSVLAPEARARARQCGEEPPQAAAPPPTRRVAELDRPPSASGWPGIAPRVEPDRPDATPDPVAQPDPRPADVAARSPSAAPASEPQPQISPAAARERERRLAARPEPAWDDEPIGVDAERADAPRDLQRDALAVVPTPLREPAQTAAPTPDPVQPPPGPSRDTVRLAQQLLAQMGYRPGPADGAAGPATLAALSAFQGARDLTSLPLDDALVAALRSAREEGHRAADTPPQIREAQTVLAALGFAPGSADGVMGPSTRRAVEAFRSQAGLGDGGVDDGLLGALRAAQTQAAAQAEAEAAAQRAAQERALEAPQPEPEVAARPRRLASLGAALAPPRRGLPPGSRFRDCEQCPEMVVLPPGEFIMGSWTDEARRAANEDPAHRVRIDAPFAVARHETSWDEWDACVAAGACDSRIQTQAGADEGWGRGPRPVINVSRNDALTFASWLNSQPGAAGYRLLSEAEWEYAARAGSSEPYPTGARITRSDANFGAEQCCSGVADGRDLWERTAPVGSFPANAFGLFDMHGNVREWVADCWHDSYHGAPADGSAWTEACNPSLGVNRGGSWIADPPKLRSAARLKVDTGVRNGSLGFRVARTLD